MGRVGLVLYLILALFIGVCAGTLLGKKYGTFPHMAREAVENPLLSNKNQSDISAEEIELIQGTGGDIEWILRAGSADYDQEKGLVIADKPGYILSWSGPQGSFVSALHGEVSQKGEGLKLWDDVKGHYGDMGLVADSP